MRELERRLATEDAAFVRRFDAVRSSSGLAARPASDWALEPAALTAAVLLRMVGAVVLGVLMLLAGSVAGVIACAGAAAVIAVIWWYANEPRATPEDPGRSAVEIHPPDGTPD